MNLILSKISKTYFNLLNSNHKIKDMSYETVLNHLLTDKYLKLLHSINLVNKSGFLAINIFENSLNSFSRKNKVEEDIWNELDNILELSYDYENTGFFNKYPALIDKIKSLANQDKLKTYLELFAE